MIDRSVAEPRRRAQTVLLGDTSRRAGAMCRHVVHIFFGVPLTLGLLVGTLSAQISFTEEAQSRGVIVVPSGGGLGSGTALEDLDQDGDLDLVLATGNFGEVRFFENDGLGNFAVRNIGVAAPALLGHRGISVCDYDADGKRDIYLTHENAPNVLLHNEGSWVFTDVTATAGVGHPGNSTGSTWGDIDGDGDLDLYVVNFDGAYGTSGEPANELFRNEGNGTFVAVGAVLGVDDPKTGFQALLFDPDLDGDLDLYVSNDRGQLDPSIYHNEFWRNDGDVFTPLDNSGAEIAIDSMGVALGDFDGTGTLDLFITNSPPGVHELLLGTGDGTSFTSGTATAGVGSPFVGWGAEFLDLDHDTDLELYAVNSNDVNHLWECSGGFPCVDIALSAGLHDTTYSAIPSRSYCFASGDIDGDGDLDLAVSSNNEPVALQINGSIGLGDWLIVDLVGNTPNLDAIGATILLDDAGETQIRQVRAGSGFRSSSALRQHFGLGTTSGTIERLRILWPNGDLSMLESVSVNQRIVIEQWNQAVMVDCDGNLYPDVLEIFLDPGLDTDTDGVLDSCAPGFIRGDATDDGMINIADPISILGFLFSAEPTDCEQRLDANGDATTNIADAIAVLGFLFTGAPPPPAPFPDCGPGATAPGALPCSDSVCP